MQSDFKEALELYQIAETASEAMRAEARQDPSALDSPAQLGELSADSMLGHAQALHKALRCDILSLYHF